MSEFNLMDAAKRIVDGIIGNPGAHPELESFPLIMAYFYNADIDSDIANNIRRRVFDAKMHDLENWIMVLEDEILDMKADLNYLRRRRTVKSKAHVNQKHSWLKRNDKNETWTCRHCGMVRTTDGVRRVYISNDGTVKETAGICPQTNKY